MTVTFEEYEPPILIKELDPLFNHFQRDMNLDCEVINDGDEFDVYLGESTVLNLHYCDKWIEISNVLFCKKNIVDFKKNKEYFDEFNRKHLSYISSFERDENRLQDKGYNKKVLESIHNYKSGKYHGLSLYFICYSNLNFSCYSSS